MLVDAQARKVARTLGSHVELDELRSYGREGLLLAARRYDASYGVPFRSYAAHRVRGAIIDGVRRSSPLPRRIQNSLQMMAAANTYSEHVAPEVFGPTPPGEQPLDARKVLDDHLTRMATAMAMGLVGRAAVGDDGELVSVSPDRSPEEEVEAEQLRALIHQHVAELPEDEAELVRRHYFHGERFDQVAEELGLSKSWASRLHARAIGRLTKRLRHLQSELE